MSLNEFDFEASTGMQAWASPKRMLKHLDWFTPGVHVVVDGQFGSTGKGLIAAWMAEHAQALEIVTSNAGPNSGHTSYYDGQKIVLCQLPTASVFRHRMGKSTMSILNAGAVINPETLMLEMAREPGLQVRVHPHAALIKGADLMEPGSCSAIASTNKGVGPAMARKLLREEDAVFESWYRDTDAADYVPDTLQLLALSPMQMTGAVTMMEVSQGYSLGLNSGFYPHCTSRECTVAQAISDANIPITEKRRVVASFRTFPIRVGNTDKGHSGGWYSDQREITWDQIGVEPELTTVTKRVRRVATFSWKQYMDAIAINGADAIFLNFMNYLKPDARARFVEKAVDIFQDVRGCKPDFVALGYGPKNADIGVLARG